MRFTSLKSRAVIAAGALLSACLPSVALAQDTTPQATSPAPDNGGCELHVWPAQRFQAMTTGLLGGGLIDAAAHAKGDRERKAAMSNALDSPNQLAALSSLDLVALLKQRHATIVTHAEPLERHTINDIKTRRSDSKSSCYSELFVADLFYQKAAIYGRSFRALFIYREFGSSPTATRIYKGWGGNGLKLFPAKPGEDIEAANNELVSVFKSDFQEFAKNEVSNQSAKH